ncbi:hypothetical protein CLOM_g13438 [Closterium sp. NIES-68]|nr:hypothetical protein CLOM_g13438 [Closterium sp. NIES-68]
MAEESKPYRVLERGDIFFFYRPKVNREEAHSVDEVQRFYMLLRPLADGERADNGEGSRRKQVKTEEGVEEEGVEEEGVEERKHSKEEKEEQQEEQGAAKWAGGGAETEERADEEGAEGERAEDKRPPLRLLVVGRKLLPDPSHRSRPHWGYVDAVSHNVEEIKEALKGETYETKTRGTRHLAAARVAAAGRYLIVSHVLGDRGGGGEPRSSRKAHTHLVYSLRWPEAEGGEEQAGGKEEVEGGEGGGKGEKENRGGSEGGRGKGAGQEEEEESPQEAFNIEREASYVLQIKNPETATTQSASFNRPSVRLEAFPLPLQHRLNGLRFAPADPPGFLNHPGCEVLLIAASDDLKGELGREIEGDLAVGRSEGAGGRKEGGGGGGEEVGGEESGHGSGCEGDEWMGFVREGLGWESEQLLRPMEAGEWA